MIIVNDVNSNACTTIVMIIVVRPMFKLRIDYLGIESNKFLNEGGGFS